MNNTSFIFLDAEGKRWSRVKLFTVAASLLAAMAVLIFFRILFIKPAIYLPQSILQMKDRIRAEQKQVPRSNLYASKRTWQDFTAFKQTPKTRPEPYDSKKAVHRKPTGNVLLGFYVGWDHNSLASLKRNASRLTHVCPEWLSVVDSTGRLKEEEWDENFLKVVHDSNLALMPLLNNLKGESWQPEAVEGLATADTTNQADFFAKILQKLESVGASGLVVDWGQLDSARRNDITALIKGLADALHGRNMELWLCVPMGLELKAYDLEELSDVTDHFIAMLQDENGENDAPGPIASPQWLEGWAETVASYGRPEQWIIGLGVYGYDWPVSESAADGAAISLRNAGNKAQLITFKDAMARAIKADIHTLETGPPFYQPHFSYEDNGISHEVWFSDAVSFLYQARLVKNKLKNGGLAITFLGAEDPGIWKAISLIGEEELTPVQLNAMESLPSADMVANVGKGEFLTVEWEQMDGKREIFIKDGQPVAVYKTIPKYLTLYHQAPVSSNQVAITFDDGPDPKWTPRILEILKKYNIKATFFVLGVKVEDNPRLLRRILEEGHEIGIHSYTHPDMYTASEERIILELNASQRLIETITGHSTILFRPPYSDCMPHTASELRPFKIAQDMGYLTVAYTIDTEDWARPGVDNILKRVRQQRSEGNIVLMHDAGGNREQTIEALPLVIEYLRKRGDDILPLSEMLNIPDTQLMPETPVQQSGMVSLISAAGFFTYRWMDELLWAFIVLSTLLVIFRIGMILFYAQRYKMPASTETTGYLPPVTAVLPAYNEEKVIANTLKALLSSDYKGGLEILVVNDGSTDRTAEVVERLAGLHPSIRLITQKNQGKAAAIKRGLEEAGHDLVVMLDADTLFEPRTVSRLVMPLLQDQSIGAVSGHARVGNRNNLITKFQALEYMCSFNLDRRAYDALNCITVVPGAVCAVRKSAVRHAGGISMDTLAEDTDLTLALHKVGYRIRYASSAVAWTEAPETVNALIKQRVRWVYGTLQCLWKHRDMLFDMRYKALGWFALPSIWFYHVFLAAIGPFLDLLFFKSLFGAANGAIYFYFGAFTLLEIALVLMSIKKERESLWNLWILLPMRFTYRYILALVVWRSIVRALKGVWLGWGKLERTASVMPERAAGIN
ncbi:MAG: polysaccharide deacetylase family protein [Dissulfuribacterales bacterium]